jgi:hypothetical protein
MILSVLVVKRFRDRVGRKDTLNVTGVRFVTFSTGAVVTLFAEFQFHVRRFRRDRQGAALLGWALVGALISCLVAWSVDLAARESRAHAIAQTAW